MRSLFILVASGDEKAVPSASKINFVSKRLEDLGFKIERKGRLGVAITGKDSLIVETLKIDLQEINTEILTPVKEDFASHIEGVVLWNTDHNAWIS